MKKLFARLALASLVICLLQSALSTVEAQGTAFTYQGQLQNNGSPANGNYDFTFALFNTNSTNAGQVGGTLADTNVGVTNGLFAVTLDFGSVFTGNPAWLAIGVRTNGGGGFTALSPLQPLTPTPYAIYTPNAGAAARANSVAGSNITGTVPLAQLPGAVVTNSETSVTLNGTFSGNGAGVTGVNLLNANAEGAIAWTTNNLYTTNFFYAGFVLASSPAVGDAPRSVCAVDVNGDGKLDLICANVEDSTLTVLTNNGSGGFVLASSPAVGDAPVSVCAADVNGDGKLDLICANAGDGTLTVLTNDGSGGFVISSSPVVGYYVYSVCAADVNGDGKVDLISANYGDGTLSVLTNDGSGGFVLASSPTVGLFPYSVCAADVNGDGKVDLISANYGDGTLTVLTNDGSGGFVLASSPAVGNRPQSVCPADVNGDGKVDLISANYGDGTLTVLTNDGSGGFVLAPPPALGSQPDSVCAADVNGDGKVDLICANQNGNTLTVLTNNGSGGFVISSSPAVGNNPQSVCAADVNGDGKMDLISANEGDGTLTVLTNASVVTVVPNPPFTAGFTGNGSLLSNLNPTNLGTGTAAISISGNAATATSATSATSFTGPLAGDVTGTQGATIVSVVGGQTAGNVATGASAANAATSANTASTIVKRDAIGNFSAGTISANLSGNAISATYFSGSLSGGVTGTQGATTVSSVGGQTAANVASGASAANAATSANTTNTIVKRDASGNFSAATITANLSGNATSATSATTATTAVNFSGSLSGDVTGTQGVTKVTLVGGQTAANVAGGASSANAATSANTGSTIVKRDASGNFSAGTITANLSGSATSSATATTATSFSGSLSGDVTGTQNATVVSSPNVALLNRANQTFTGANVFNNTAGVGFNGPLNVTNLGDSGGLTVNANGFNAAVSIVASGGGGLAANLALAKAAGSYSSDAQANDMVVRTAILSQRLMLQTGSGHSAIFISSTNSVGIGTNNPSATLEVNGPVASDYGYRCRAGISGPYGANYFNFYWTGTQLEAWIDGTDVNGNLSDPRLKEDIKPMEDNALERIMSLKPVSFKFKNIPDTVFTGSPDVNEGFLATDLQEVVPSAVHGTKDGKTSNGKIQPMAIKELPLVAVLTKAMQEQQKEIEALKEKAGKADSLEKQLNELRQMVQTLAEKK